MRCQEARQRWHDRFDSGRPDEALDRHVAACAACRVYAAQMDQIAAALTALRAETKEITAGPRPVEERGGHRRLPKRLRRGLRLAPLGIAAVVTLLAAARFWLPPGANRPQSSISDLRPSGSAAESVRAPIDEPWGPGIEDPRIGVTLRGGSAERFLPVAEPQVRDDVAVFWLLPTAGHKIASGG